MARAATIYVCQACGATHRRWMGRCEACGEWNTLVEESTRGTRGDRPARPLELVPLSGASAVVARQPIGLSEFDRVLGGGLVPGSAILIGGDPGIGKSTLLLQAAGRLAAGGARTIYVSGEEAIDQVRLRAVRLGLADAPVALASATSVAEIVATIEAGPPPAMVVIDSIQTMSVEVLDSAPGTVAQVRASAQALIRVAKQRGIAVLLVGHVTKEGVIAGPRVLEHMVDTVLYFEGERGHAFRILRAVKNRYGATDEIGVFEMTGEGLLPVENPSALFLADRAGREQVSGAAVFAGIEGTRPLLVEIQALVGPPGLATPRRAVVGWDSGRLAMVLAVLETRCGLAFGGRDVYLNVAGGLRIAEPAADLAVAAALSSALLDRPIPPETVLFGEVGLGGEVRGVGQPAARLKEAAKLGFRQAIVPGQPGVAPAAAGLEIDPVARLQEMVDRVRDFAPAVAPSPRRGYR